jgi:formamidopyrimidine-DNA glycosylase
LNDEFTPETLRELFKNRRGNLKALLLNQHFVAGIGNIYADEILHLAKLRPDRLPGRLTNVALTRLHDAIIEVLNKAVNAGGSTLKDTQYVDLDGQTGSFQDEPRLRPRWAGVSELWKRSNFDDGRCGSHDLLLLGLSALNFKRVVAR